MKPKKQLLKTHFLGVWSYLERKFKTPIRINPKSIPFLVYPNVIFESSTMKEAKMKIELINKLTPRMTRKENHQTTRAQ